MKITSIPQIYRHVNRWREILSILSKYGLADWLSHVDIELAKNLLKNQQGEALARQSRERRIRLALVELGPTFIKLGQILSTRADLVGRELADELSHLQDNAPADDPAVIRAIISTELGKSVDDLFEQFDEVPLASASIGQVHQARLKTGERVAVKVQHAGIERKVEIDLEVMAGLAQLAERLPDMAVYRPRSTVAEFQRILRRELDFEREERNMLEFGRQFAGDATVRIPAPFPELCSRRVLTMDLLEGVKVSNTTRLREAGFDLQEVAQRGADMYLKMIFDHGFYHADPHPGNLMILPGNVLGLLDFGMVGRLDDQLREDFEGMLLAIVGRDATQLTTIIARMGQTPPDLDFAGLSLDVAEFVSHYGNQPADQLNLGEMLNEMTDMIRRHQIMLPSRVALLLKVFVMLEGTSRLLHPKFSLLEVMRPHQKKMFLRRVSPARQLKKMRRIYFDLEHLIEVLPRRVLDIMQQFESGKLDVHLDHRGLEPSVNRLVLGMLSSAIFLGSALLLSHKVAAPLWDISIPGTLGCMVSVAMGLRVLWAIRKSGNLDRRK